MFDRFSENARKVMGLARREAERLNHEYIGTEHILLGIVAEPCAATSILEGMGVSAPRVRGAVEQIVKPGPPTVKAGTLPFTPRAKRTLELALEEAGPNRGVQLGTTHLLLGLLREGTGGATQALGSLGVTLDALRSHITASRGNVEPAGPAIPVEIELKEGMRVVFRQAVGTKNTLEIFVEKGILYITDRAKDARVQVVIRPGVRHAFAVHSWSEPPHPEIETA